MRISHPIRDNESFTYKNKEMLMKTIEELRNELLKIGEQLGGGTRPKHYFFITDDKMIFFAMNFKMGLQLPILKFMAKNIILSSVKEALRYSEK